MKKFENTIGFYVRKIRDLVLDTDKIRIVHGVLEDVVRGGCVGGRMSPHTSPALFIISDWRMFMFCKCEVLMQQGKVSILAMAISIYIYWHYQYIYTQFMYVYWQHHIKQGPENWIPYLRNIDPWVSGVFAMTLVFMLKVSPLIWSLEEGEEEGASKVEWHSMLIETTTSSSVAASSMLMVGLSSNRIGWILFWNSNNSRNVGRSLIKWKIF